VSFSVVFLLSAWERILSEEGLPETNWKERILRIVGGVCPKRKQDKITQENTTFDKRDDTVFKTSFSSLVQAGDCPRDFVLLSPFSESSREGQGLLPPGCTSLLAHGNLLVGNWLLLLVHTVARKRQCNAELKSKVE